MSAARRPVTAAATAILVGLLAGVGGAANQKPGKDAPPDDKDKKDAKVDIREFGDGKELKWADVKMPDVRVPLTLEALTKEGLADVTVAATPFGGSGQDAAVSIDGKPSPLAIASLKQGQPQTVVLTATMPAAGTYRSYVQVHEKGVRLLSGVVEIVRTRAAVPIDVGVMPAQMVPLDFLRHPASASFVTSLTSQGETVALDAPLVKSSTYKDKATATTSIAARIDVKTVQAKPLVVTASPVPLTVDIAGIDAPGRYDVTLSFPGRGYSPATADFTFYARQASWVAGVWIFLGVAVSFFLRFYGVIGRPSLVNRQRVNTLFRELDERAAVAGSDAYALALVQDIRRKLTEHWSAQAAVGTLTDASVLDAYAAKIAALAPWFELRGRVARLQPASLRKTFEDKLVAAEAVLRNQAATVKDVSDQVTILDGMPPLMDQAVADALRKQIADFEKRLQDDPRFGDILGGLADVEKQVAASSLDDAIASLNRLELRYVRVVADDLEQALKATPVEVPPPVWSDTVARVTAAIGRARSATTGAEAIEAFQQGLGLYLRVVSSGLLTDVQNKIAAGSQYAARYQEIKKTLDQVVSRLDAGELGTAWSLFKEALEDYQAVRKDASGTLGAAAAVVDAVSSLSQGAGAAADFDILSIFRVPGGATGLVSASLTAAGGLRLAGDIVATLIILVAAVLLGVQTLWVDNLTWGGPASFLAAFLWGLGFDQLTHAGLLAMMKKG